MLKNYLKVAFRSIQRNKIYAFINLAGLTVGITCALLIFLYVQDELSFDRQHPMGDRIYRLTCKYYLPNDAGSEFQAPIGPAPGDALLNDYPEVEDVTRINRVYYNQVILHPETQREVFEDVAFADSSLFQMFNFPMLHGDPVSALTSPFQMVISREAAMKYFGRENVVGEQLVSKSDTVRRVFTITGVMADFPNNSHIQLDLVGSITTLKGLGWYLENWWSFSFYTYLLLKEGVDAQAFEEKISGISHKYIPDQEEGSGYSQEYHLQALPDIHLHSDLRSEMSPNNKASFIYIFILIGVFMLLIACINFMHLATARSMQRAREVGIRKTVGATRDQLIGQFMGESTLMSVISLVLALCLVQFFLPFFNAFTEKELNLRFWENPGLGLAIIGIGAFVGMLSGSYPAIFLSRFDPVRVLRGRFVSSAQGKWLRKTLVVFQFTISIALIASTILVYKQLHYMKTKDLGFEKENTVVLSMKSRVNSYRQFQVLKERLNQLSEVSGTTLSSQVPGVRLSNNVVRIGWGEDAGWSDMRYLTVDDDYLQEYGLELAAGRFFEEGRGSDEGEAFLLNESGAKRLGYTDPQEAIGLKLQWQGRQGQVIGVVQDFHFMSVNQQIEPFIVIFDKDRTNYLSIRVSQENLEPALLAIESAWMETLPDRVFEYELLEDSYDLQYRKYERFNSFFLFFALIAVFIACLGLFGLAAYTAQTRTKEIGIRKVHGAPISNLIFLLTKEFSFLVLLAFVLASPAVYYGMSAWLEEFAFRIEITPDIFLLAGTIALLIAFLTVSYHSVRAALANPVKALRYE